MDLIESYSEKKIKIHLCWTPSG